MNYRELLGKYMRVVAANEGTTFVDSCEAPEFTIEEKILLRTVDASPEVRKASKTGEAFP